MSAFSAVDDAQQPSRLVELLDESAAGLAAMKQYIAVTHALRSPAAPVLDLGCGAGHDLTLLDGVGVPAVGIDPSSVMLAAASERTTSPLVRAGAERLSFPDNTFAGCWIERVLQHVVDPSAVIAEVVRCVQSEGLLTIFEPDWSSVAVNGSLVPAEWITATLHPAIGSAVGGLLEAANCTILDRVDERSWWTFDELRRFTNLERSLDRVVANRKASRAEVQHWLGEQQQRAAAGDFRAEMSKILWVATTPP